MDNIDQVHRFVQLLSDLPASDRVFNPWKDVDTENDMGSSGPEIRKRHLAHYLDARLDKAKYIILGEAVGYQGGHFSGIAMTSERILLGHCRDKGILPEHVLPGLKPRRTSKPGLNTLGFTEPTATVVWSTILHEGLDPYEFVLWNTCAWHPFQKEKGLLSNRKPQKDELEKSVPVLHDFLALFSSAAIFAMGNVASAQLTEFGLKHHKVRHPAQGGAALFRRQIAEFFN